MHFSFTLLNEPEAKELQTWRYDEPYTTYNLTEGEAALAELLDRRSPYYAVRNMNGEPVAFLAMGSAALVGEIGEPRIYVAEQTIAIGLGMRPDLAGKGMGLDFVEACLDFVRQEFAPQKIVLYVFSWNTRARRVYERAGFQAVRTVQVANGAEFLEMQIAL